MNFIDIKNNRFFNESDVLLDQLRAGVIADGQAITLKAMVYRIRVMSNFCFVLVSTAKSVIQCIYSPDFSKFEITTLKEGDFIEIHGTAVKEPQSRIGYDIRMNSVVVLSTPVEMPPFVVNKKELDIGIDMKLNYRPISLRNQKEKVYFKLVDGILQGFRRFLSSQGFTEFVAPKFVSAGAEGGSDMFVLDYFKQHALLAQSPQVYKQMMVGVFERVFTVGPVFRAEKSHTSRHLTEFTGVDIEMGYINGFEDIMNMEARALRTVISFLNENYADELKLLNVNLKDFDKVPVVKFMDAKNLVADKYKRKFRSPDDLEPEEEQLIGEYFKKEHNSMLVFVTHYPTKKRPFYTMEDPTDPDYTFSFDLLLNGAEITTGGQRIHDYEMQTAKMNRLGMNINEFESYLMIHKYGMPPHGGLGLGLERLAMKLFNCENIRTTTLFPRDVDRLNP